MSDLHPIERNHLDFDTRARMEQSRAMRAMWRGLRRTFAPAKVRRRA